jgi:argininosuccinate lyase
VQKGVPFRSSHEIAGRIVSYCLKEKKALTSLALSEWKKFSLDFNEDILNFASLEKAVERRNHIGGTSKKQVLKRIREIEAGD